MTSDKDNTREKHGTVGGTDTVDKIRDSLEEDEDDE